MMAPTELVHVGESRSPAVAASMPVMDMNTALERREAVREFISKIMKDDEDYGLIPGAKKPSLWKPGAEKLTAFFGLAPRFDVEQRIEQWDAPEPFFHYEIKCRLIRDDEVRGEGLGSCNSRETKYRWRQGERLCPACGKPCIIKGKDDFGGGWLCFAKKGGCGAKYKDGDPSIEDQQTGRIPNPDVADLVNTILKMAKKRAHIDAVLNTTGASQFFTQDAEDLPEESGGWGGERGRAPAPPQKKAPQAPPQRQTAPPPTPWDELGTDAQAPPGSGTEPPPPTRDEILGGAFQEFTKSSTADRITLFRKAKKTFQELLGKDAGEVRYQEWLMASDVSKPEDFKTLVPARDCYMHMVGQILDIGAQHGV
jgi:hypothetical protein